LTPRKKKKSRKVGKTAWRDSKKAVGGTLLRTNRQPERKRGAKKGRTAKSHRGSVSVSIEQTLFGRKRKSHFELCPRRVKGWKGLKATWWEGDEKLSGRSSLRFYLSDIGRRMDVKRTPQEVVRQG